MPCTISEWRGRCVEWRGFGRCGLIQGVGCEMFTGMLTGMITRMLTRARGSRHRTSLCPLPVPLGQGLEDQVWAQKRGVKTSFACPARTGRERSLLRRQRGPSSAPRMEPASGASQESCRQHTRDGLMDESGQRCVEHADLEVDVACCSCVDALEQLTGQGCGARHAAEFPCSHQE